MSTIPYPLCDERLLGDLRQAMPEREIRVVDHDTVEVVDPPVKVVRVHHPAELGFMAFTSFKLYSEGCLDHTTNEQAWPNRLFKVVNKVLRRRQRQTLVLRAQLALSEADLPKGWFLVREQPTLDYVEIVSNEGRIPGVGLATHAGAEDVRKAISTLRESVETLVRTSVAAISYVVTNSRGGADLVSAAMGPQESQMLRLLSADRAHKLLDDAGFDGDLLTQVTALLEERRK